jgi:tetratricopeptide (TPR) repeat protein
MVMDTARDAEAWELMQSAHRLIRQGEWAQAGSALEKAAAIHREAGREYDEARCLQLAATLERSSGDLSKARRLADRAASVAPGDLPLAVSIASERAETALAEGRYDDALRLWHEAIAQARQAHAKPEGLSAMLRRLAAAQMASGTTEEAGQSFDEAARLIQAAMSGDAAGFVRTEQAGLLLQHGRVAEAVAVLQGIDSARSPHLHAETLVMQARAARTTGHLDQALQLAQDARDAAREAAAPVSYFAGALELAQAFDASGDSMNAYGALATAQATLGDVLGLDAARSWIEPILMAYHMKWGESAFQDARRQYEARRRAERQEKHDG